MTPEQLEKLESIERVREGYAELGYICSRQIATAIYVAGHLGKPVLVEGPAGVGKTELANTTAAYLDLPLIRLQCYEGLDEAKALYEWRYAKQLLYTQILRDKLGEVLGEAQGIKESMDRLHAHADVFFSERFLAPRPLLKALREPGGAVLLIDEVDKSDHEFEAFLLEILSEFQVSIPELGTIKAARRPVVFLTSNNTREMSDALKRALAQPTHSGDPTPYEYAGPPPRPPGAGRRHAKPGAGRRRPILWLSTGPQSMNYNRSGSSFL